jgi:alkaline phosphatase
MPVKKKLLVKLPGRVRPPAAAIGVLLLFASLSAWTIAAGCLPPRNPPYSYQPAKHIILIIGDGMHLQHEIAASRYLHGTDRGLTWHAFPEQAYVTTWDVDTYNRYAAAAGARPYDPAAAAFIGYDPAKGGNAPFPDCLSGKPAYFLTALPLRGPKKLVALPATDSASAATAMATGHKTDAGNISWRSGDPDGGGLRTIAELLEDRRGAKLGLVTTVPFTHATVAAFACHNKSRHNYYTGLKGYAGRGLAEEIIDFRRPEVVIGGGHPKWNNPGFSKDRGFISKRAYGMLLRSDNYVLVERGKGRSAREALLAGLARARARGKKLFGLFGGRDGAFERPIAADEPGRPAVSPGSSENPTLAEATRFSLRLLRARRKPFLAVVEQGDIDWANHKNDYRWMIGAMVDMDRAVRAAVRFVDEPDDGIDWSNTLLIVTSDHANGFMRLTQKHRLTRGKLPTQTRSGGISSYPNGEVSYGTTRHTNELVTIYAKGRGAKLLRRHVGRRYPGTRVMDNTEIYQVMAQAAGLSFLPQK